MSKKDKHIIKHTKETIAFNGYRALTTSDKNNKTLEYLEHRIEKRENSIVFRAYIEKSYDINSPKDMKELETILEKQKSPLPKVITKYEKECWKDAKDNDRKNGKPNIYNYTDMYQVKEL